MREKVEKIIKSDIEPMLKEDGGGIELIDVDEKEGIVKVKLQGACTSCPFSEMTLKNLVEQTLKSKIPEIKKIESV